MKGYKVVIFSQFYYLSCSVEGFGRREYVPYTETRARPEMSKLGLDLFFFPEFTDAVAFRDGRNWIIFECVATGVHEPVMEFNLTLSRNGLNIDGTIPEDGHDFLIIYPEGTMMAEGITITDRVIE